MTSQSKSKVSIIIPVFNAEKYVKETLDSVCRQSYENIEVIVVNDGSTDQSMKILNGYHTDKKIKIISIKNSGVSVARNVGIENAKGEYITFVDSDDTIEKYMIEKLVDAIESGDYGMAICGIKMCYYKKHRVKKVDVIPHANSVKTKKQFDDTFHDLYESKSYMSPWAKLYRRDIIETYNIRFSPNVKIGEDMLFNFDFLTYRYTSKVIKQALYNYRIDAGEKSLSKDYTKGRINNNFCLLQNSVEFIEKNKIMDRKAYCSVLVYFYVSTLLVIQGYLYDLKECRNVINEVKQRIDQNHILKLEGRKEWRVVIYQWAFSRKSPCIVWGLSWLRMLIKKIIR